jgi:hypothetical protein
MRASMPPPPSLDDLIKEAIARDEIIINTQFLASLENSLIIGDEIHNTYNMVSKNNRGVAIQFVLEKVLKSDKLFFQKKESNFPCRRVIF